MSKKFSPYVAARHKLIPQAASSAHTLCLEKHGKRYSRESYIYEYSREMVRLAEEAGITSPGNLALFDNTKIKPFCVATATLGARHGGD